jgi:hypothetical protein
MLWRPDRTDGRKKPLHNGWGNHNHLRRFAATLRLADSPALRREAAQPSPDSPQKEPATSDKSISGLDPVHPWLTIQLEALTTPPIIVKGFISASKTSSSP